MSESLEKSKKSVLTFKARGYFTAWLVVVVALALLLIWRVNSGLVIETSILNLLTSPKEGSGISATAIAQSSKFNRQMLFLIGHPDKTDALKASELFATQLNKSQLYESVVYKIGLNKKALREYYSPLGYRPLDPKTRVLLKQEGGIEELLEQNKMILYAPMGGLGTTNLSDDPLLLFPRFLQTLPALPKKTYIADDTLLVSGENKTYAIISANLAGNPFTPDVQASALDHIQTSIRDLQAKYPKGVVLYTGIMRFAADSARRMEKEGTLIGWGSLFCVLVLLVGTFRSIHQLALSALSIGVGLLAAIVFSSLIFSKLHLLALVFGVSLTGICIDYSVHYFAYHCVAGSNWNPQAGMRAVLPGISLGALTSIIGFAGLAFADFPGLQQISVFSSFGIIGAYFTVVCCFPVFLRKPIKERKPIILRIAQRILQAWYRLRPTRILGVVDILGCLFLFALVLHIKVNDDVSLLQKVSEPLLANEKKIRSLTSRSDQSRFFLVQGQSEQEVLERLEILSEKLAKSVAAKDLKSFLSLARFIPSKKQQELDRKLLAEVFLKNRLLFSDYFSELGFAEDTLPRIEKLLTEKPTKLLTPENWSDNTIAAANAVLGIGKTAEGFIALVSLTGIQHEENLMAINNTIPGVSYINIVSEINSMMKGFREQATLLVLASYLFILIVLILRYGLRRGIAVMIPPIFAALIALTALSVFGEKLNVVHIISLLLVLAVGIDYPIFFAEQKKHREETMFVITLCALTTICSFGLMAISKTPILHSFGFMLIVGVLSALLLAPYPLLVFDKESAKDNNNDINP